MGKAEWDTLLFLWSFNVCRRVICIWNLAYTAEVTYIDLGPTFAKNVLVGILSAMVDNSQSCMQF